MKFYQCFHDIFIQNKLFAQDGIPQAYVFTYKMLTPAIILRTTKIISLF